jgi:hemoglobin
LADPLQAPYFGDVGMDRQVAKQAAFLTMALGGPDRYTGA